jgi:hypothetical protein
MNDDNIHRSGAAEKKVERLETLIDGISMMCVQNVAPKSLADRIIERIRLYHQRDNQIKIFGS